MPTPKKTRTRFGAAALKAVSRSAFLVDEAGAAFEELEAAEARLEPLRENYRQRYQAALEGGWTKDQLNNLDDPLPAPKAVRAPRKSSGKATAPTASAGSPGEAEPVGTGEVETATSAEE